MSYSLKGDEIQAQAVELDESGNPIVRKAGIGSLVIILGVGSVILYSLATKSNWVGSQRKVDIRRKRRTSGYQRPLP